jgi:hypothetical protein
MAFKAFWDVESIDLTDWMQKIADSKRCSRAVWQNGRVVEVVVRE